MGTVQFDVNLQEHNMVGMTPIHLACSTPSLGIAIELLHTNILDFSMLDNCLMLPSQLIPKSYLSSRKCMVFAEKSFFQELLSKTENTAPRNYHAHMTDMNRFHLNSFNNLPKKLEIKKNIPRKLSFNLIKPVGNLTNINGNQTPILESKFDKFSESHMLKPPSIPRGYNTDKSNFNGNFMQEMSSTFTPRVQPLKKRMLSINLKNTLDKMKPSFIPNNIGIKMKRQERSIDENISLSELPISNLTVRLSKVSSRRSDASDSSSISQSHPAALESLLRTTTNSIRTWAKKIHQQISLNLLSSYLRSSSLIEIHSKLAKLRYLIKELTQHNQPERNQITDSLVYTLTIQSHNISYLSRSSSHYSPALSDILSHVYTMYIDAIHPIHSTRSQIKKNIMVLMNNLMSSKSFRTVLYIHHRTRIHDIEEETLQPSRGPGKGSLHHRSVRSNVLSHVMVHTSSSSNVHHHLQAGDISSSVEGSRRNLGSLMVRRNKSRDSVKMIIKK